MLEQAGRASRSSLRRLAAGDDWADEAKRNLLLVLLDGATPAALGRAVRRRLDEAASVHVVAPSRVGILDWLATEEDDARAAAEVRALKAEWALAADAVVEREAGDVDPIVAVEDSYGASTPTRSCSLEEEPKTEASRTRSSGSVGRSGGWTVSPRSASVVPCASSAARSGRDEAN